MKNVSRTARAQVSSSVNRCRSQSHEQPSCLSWPVIRFSYCSFHLPDAIDQALAPEVVPALALFLQQPPLHDRLSGDARVVGAGHPEDFEPLHPLAAAEDVLQRVVQRVPQVQRTGDVRRGDDDRVGQLLAGENRRRVRVEVAPFVFQKRYHFACAARWS